MADSCQPDGWFKIGNPTLEPAFVSAEFGPGASGKILKGTFAPNEGFGQYLGILTAGTGGGLVNEETIVGTTRGRRLCTAIDCLLDSTSTSS